jgi:membrane protease YdiL (CAAX protease family)
MSIEQSELKTGDARKASGNRLGEVAAWLVILAVVSFLVLNNVRRSGTNRGPDLINDLQLKMVVQEAIAFKAVQSRAGQGSAATINQSNRRLIQLMDREAQTPEAKLRVAIAVGYLQGRDGALGRLDTISQTPGASRIADDVMAVRTIWTDGVQALSPAESARLIQKYDYFGHMALAYGSAPGTDAVKSVESSAVRTLLVLGIVGFALIVLIFVSLAALVAAIYFASKGKIRRQYISNANTRGVFLQGFAIYLVLFVMLGLTLRLAGLSNLNWEWLAWLIIPIVILRTVRGNASTDWRTGLGWHSGRGWLQEAAAGIGGYLAGCPFMAIGLVITILLMRVAGAPAANPVFTLLRGNVLATYGLACVFAPVIEETMFRGALFHHLRGRWSWSASAAVIAFIFAVIHPQGWAAIPILWSIAMVLAALREWRGSIIAPVTAHAFNNFIAITLALMLLR